MSTMTTRGETARNGVPTRQVFRATNRWIDGAHSRTTIGDVDPANQEATSRRQEFVLDSDLPTVLLGTDTGPTPAEYVLHALAACLTTSIVYVAAARGVELSEVESTLVGDMGAQGALGLSEEYRTGFEQIHVS